MKVFRFELTLDQMDRDGRFTVTMPEGARVLHVAEQQRAPHAICFWALVDDDAPPEERQFYVVGTGTETPEDIFYMDHVGTCQTLGGFVWHFFQRPLA